MMPYKYIAYILKKNSKTGISKIADIISPIGLKLNWIVYK